MGPKLLDLVVPGLKQRFQVPDQHVLGFQQSFHVLRVHRSRHVWKRQNVRCRQRHSARDRRRMRAFTPRWYVNVSTGTHQWWWWGKGGEEIGKSVDHTILERTIAALPDPMHMHQKCKYKWFVDLNNSLNIYKLYYIINYIIYKFVNNSLNYRATPFFPIKKPMCVNN